MRRRKKKEEKRKKKEKEKKNIREISFSLFSLLFFLPPFLLFPTKDLTGISSNSFNESKECQRVSPRCTHTHTRTHARTYARTNTRTHAYRFRESPVSSFSFIPREFFSLYRASRTDRSTLVNRFLHRRDFRFNAAGNLRGGRMRTNRRLPTTIRKSKSKIEQKNYPRHKSSSRILRSRTGNGGVTTTRPTRPEINQFLVN